MKWALVDSNGVVTNVIVYDGVAPYAPPEGVTLQQVNSWVQIGQPTNTPQPSGE